MINIFSVSVPEVPPEPRWSSPVRKHISCPPDGSTTSNTIALAYLVCDISDVYESFVMKIVSELLVEGPNAPFYRTLIEAGLGTGFSPSTGKALKILNIQYTIHNILQLKEILLLL